MGISTQSLNCYVCKDCKKHVNMWRNSTAQRSTAQHSTAHCSTVQHSTAHHTPLHPHSVRGNSLIGSVLQQRHLTEHDVVCFLGQLVLDGAVLGPPQQELLHQLVQLTLPGSALSARIYCHAIVML